MKEYILVESETIGVEAFCINEHGNRELREYHAPADVVNIKPINVSMKVEEIYEGTKAAASAAQRG